MSSPSRPKLLFVLSMSPEKIGGMERFLRYFTCTMDARGWDTVLCFENSVADVCRAYFARTSVTIEIVTGQPDLGMIAAPQLHRLMKRHRPNVFVYAFDGVMRVFPWIAQIGGAHRIFFNDHSSRPMGTIVRRMPLLKRIAGRFLTAPLTGIISVCEFVATSSEKTGLVQKPNTVVWNGVEVSEPESERGRLFRTKYGIPQHAVVFSMSVWMVEVKGVDVLLRAAAPIMLADDHIWLLLVGDGPKTDEYRKLAKDLGISARVVFTGLVSDPVARGVFDASDVLCQPSLWQEANPLAVLEAMSMKLPVLASDIGGLPEIVKHDITGFLFPAGDSEVLRERMIQLTFNAELRSRMGAAGRTRVLQHHDINKVAARYADILVG